MIHPPIITALATKFLLNLCHNTHCHSLPSVPARKHKQARRLRCPCNKATMADHCLARRPLTRTPWGFIIKQTGEHRSHSLCHIMRRVEVMGFEKKNYLFFGMYFYCHTQSIGSWVKQSSGV